MSIDANTPVLGGFYGWQQGLASQNIPVLSGLAQAAVTANQVVNQIPSSPTDVGAQIADTTGATAAGDQARLAVTDYVGSTVSNALISPNALLIGAGVLVGIVVLDKVL